jgi:hypothetical protein
VTYPLDPEDLHLRLHRPLATSAGTTRSTTTRRRPPAVAGDVDRDRQLALYQLAVSQRLPDVRSVKLVWHYLRTTACWCPSARPRRLRALRGDPKLVETMPCAPPPKATCPRG